MPALQLATQLSYRARDNEIKSVSSDLVLAVSELVGEVSPEAIAQILLATVELARSADLDAESVLRAETMRFRKAIRISEGLTD
jgi:hypothetical protein